MVQYKDLEKLLLMKINVLCSVRQTLSLGKWIFHFFVHCSFFILYNNSGIMFGSMDDQVLSLIPVFQK